MCKGVCCVEGDVGVLFVFDEIDVLEEVYVEVKFFMCLEGVEVVEK